MAAPQDEKLSPPSSFPQLSSTPSNNNNNNPKPPTSIHPYYTIALFLSATLQTLGSVSCVLTTRRWETAPLWVNLLFWPFLLSTILLGGLHLRELITSRREAVKWGLATVATITVALGYRQVVLHYYPEELREEMAGVEI